MVAVKHYSFNSYVAIGVSHPDHLDGFSLVYKDIGSDFPFLISFFDEIPLSKQHSPRCDLELYCLHMSQE